MLFNSYIFIFLFMPLTLIYYRFLLFLNSQRIIIFLLLVSILFYSYWEWSNLFILIPSVLFNFVCGKYLSFFQNDRQRKCLLGFAIVANISLLAYFKYLTFFINQLNFRFDAHIDIYVPNLPLGISFFTFTQIAYLVDVYSRKTKSSNFNNYTLFVTYFPHLIAGPLLHYKPMIEQFEKRFDVQSLTYNMALGSAIFIIGLFKKVVVADYFSVGADAIFNLSYPSLNQVGTLQVWKAAICYTFQLYFDFSGYCDMAVGISRFFGIALPINFNSPYKARSIGEFWRRWHITLSSFLRDYLYIPLGGSRKGFIRKLCNLMIVMTLCGIWHGAGYTYIIWGIYHGILLSIHNLWGSLRARFDFSEFRYPVLGDQISLGLTFIFVAIGWVIFRAPSVTAATVLLKTMFSIKGNMFLIPLSKREILWFLSSFIIIFYFPNSQEICRIDSNGYTLNNKATWWHWSPNLMWAMILALMLLVSLYHMNKVSPFLYFQF